MLQAAEYFKKISEILILCVELDGARELAELGNKSFSFSKGLNDAFID